VEIADVRADLSQVLFTPEQIKARLSELAADVDRDYAGKDLLLVGVLNGAVMTVADLSRDLKIHCEMQWMAISSYGDGVTSSGVLRILKDLNIDIDGRHVLVIEDIIDTGLTLSYLVQNLKSRRPASLEVLTAFRKPAAAKCQVDVKYVGFDIPNDFVVGYGLDYAGKYRNLDGLGVLDPAVYERHG
jgi:hypoxanthine phosphoribosyltransferase